MLDVILQDMQEPVFYLRYAVMVGGCITLLMTMLRLCWTAQWSFTFPIKWMVVLTYLAVLVQVALLSREPGSRTATDLIPFSTWGDTDQSRAYEIENIIMFIPMGLLLPTVWKPLQKFRWCVPTMLFLSVAIEVTQFVTKRGFMQTDDVIMNVAGGILGFLVFWILYCMARRIGGISDAEIYKENER